MIGLELVRRTEADGQLVMEWRNNPDTLKASLGQEPKVWETFWPEFSEEYFSTLYLPPLFALFDGKRVAFIRFRPMGDPDHVIRRGVEISLNIAPEFRGKKLAVPILKAALEFLAEQGVDDCFALIKSDNKASQKAFVKAGFESVDTGHIGKFIVRLTALSAPNVMVIAEAGSNWRMGSTKRDLEMAKVLVDVAVDAGADAVKFQTYRPDGVYVRNAGSSDYLAASGIKEDIHDIFDDLSMPYEMVPQLAEYCDHHGIAFMATPFSPRDFAAVDPFVKTHKIASYEISHLRLLELAAGSRKPLILSTGATTPADIRWAVDTFQWAGGGPLTLLQCTAKYPAPFDSLNLRVLPWLKSQYGVNVGLSDHSRHPTCAPTAAVALGATVVEKHFTLDNQLPGPDHAFAVTPKELKEMVRAIRKTEEALGSGVKEVLEAEKELYGYARRGLQALRDIETGDELREGVNIAILRPGQQPLGCHPKHLPSLEGKLATRNIPAGEGVHTGDVG